MTSDCACSEVMVKRDYVEGNDCELGICLQENDRWDCFYSEIRPRLTCVCNEMKVNWNCVCSEIRVSIRVLDSVFPPGFIAKL